MYELMFGYFLGFVLGMTCFYYFKKYKCLEKIHLDLISMLEKTHQELVDEVKAIKNSLINK